MPSSQYYPPEYFTGCDVNVYFNGLYIDEITALEYNVTQNMRPVYGYASYVFDRMMYGNRIVTGSFRINYKEEGYLQVLLDKLEARLAKPYNTDGLSTVLTIKRDSPDPNAKPLDVLYQAFQMDPQYFEQLAETYESALWAAMAEESVPNEPSFLRVGKNLRRYGFDIEIKFGPNSREPNTVKIIKGAHITGGGQQIEISGIPVQEVYTFIAQDVVHATSGWADFANAQGVNK